MTSAFAISVYLLCVLTSAACAVLLGRSYVRTRMRLLLWSSLCFLLLAANNLVVVIDLAILPAVDLRFFASRPFTGGRAAVVNRVHLGPGGLTLAELDFLSGAVSMGFLVCGLFFLRFWSRTKDELFVAFAVAFGLLSIGQALLALTGIPVEERSWLYLFRLAAFLLIILAILRKNVRKAPGTDPLALFRAIAVIEKLPGQNGK